MRIYLVNPAFPASLWDFALCRDLDESRYPHYPLSLPTLAALAPGDAHVTLCDENVTPVDLAMEADLVGITGYHIQLPRVLELAAAFRARGRTVVIGGPVIDRSTVDTCLEVADAVVEGEAEYTWPRLLRDLAGGCLETHYRQEGFVDLHDSPLPRFDLLDLEAYSTATIETSRGCPYSCEFCEIPVRLGQRARTKSVEQVLAEVRTLHQLGADSIFFIDDHFVGDRTRARALLEALARYVEEVSYALYFTAQISINFSKDEELLSLMHRANFRRVFVGIETPRRDSLALLRKRQNLTVDLVDAVHRIQGHNIVVWAGLIVGLDTDDADTFEEQYALLQDSAIPVAMIGLLQAIPETPLHRRLAASNRLRPDEIGGIRRDARRLLHTNIIPASDGLGAQELIRGYQRLVNDAYAYPAFRHRLVRSLCAARLPVHGSSRAITARQRNIVLRTAKYYLCTLDLRRIWFFLAALCEVALRQPRLLDQLMVHLVVYKHLRLFHQQLARAPMPAYALADERSPGVSAAAPGAAPTTIAQGRPATGAGSAAGRD